VFFDPNFARFNLNEKTSDKCHYYLFWNDKDKGPVMQYKLYRYSNLLYPRKYMESQQHHFEEYGLGMVVSTKPIKDPLTKEKFWETEVVFKNEDGTERKQLFKRPTYLDAIQLFYVVENPLPTEESFGVADFYQKIDEKKREELHSNIAMMIEKCSLSDSEKSSWKDLLESIPQQVSCVKDRQAFCLPEKQIICCYRAEKTSDIQFDTGIRQVGVVVHSKISTT
jgi:hypothetical protein